MEEVIFLQCNIATQGHRINIEESPDFTLEDAKNLYEFYKLTIPHILDINQENLWSRRAYQLYEDMLKTGEESYREELDEILMLFPTASYARDNALLKLGNTNLLQQVEQSNEINGRSKVSRHFFA